MLERQIEGVAAFIAAPKYYRVLTIEELQTKRSTNKIAGMRSIPMETVEPGESYEDALRRLLEEEVMIELGVNYSTSRLLSTCELCVFQMIPNVWVHTFFLGTAGTHMTRVGSEAKEVANPKWEHVRDILDHDLGSRLYRGGNRESVWSFLREMRNELYPRPDIYEKITDRVPAWVFDEIEVGHGIPKYTHDDELLTEKQGLFPYPLSGSLWLGSRTLVRL